jgi:hypothetical protein
MLVLTDTTPPDWSPADNPHAIAISEAKWWQRAVQLAVLRLRDPDDQRISWFSSRQIDARQLVFALRQLLSAARLADVAMETRGIDATARDSLAQARQNSRTRYLASRTCATPSCTSKIGLAGREGLALREDVGLDPVRVFRAAGLPFRG